MIISTFFEIEIKSENKKKKNFSKRIATNIQRLKTNKKHYDFTEKSKFLKLFNMKDIFFSLKNITVFS